jgi:hypothetical protein
VKCGNIDVSQSYELPRPVTGVALPYIFYNGQMNAIVNGLHMLKNHGTNSLTVCIRPRHKTIGSTQFKFDTIDGSFCHNVWLQNQGYRRSERRKIEAARMSFLR